MPDSRIIFLGHASFQVETPDGKIILVDPWLADNPKCPPAYKEPPKVDLVLITHGHGDHLDAHLPHLIQRTGATVIAHPQVRFYLNAQGVESVEPMNKGGTLNVHGCTVTMTNAFHAAHISPEAQTAIYTHEAVGYIIQTPDDLRIYFAGDTCVFGDMRLLGEIYRPHVAVLPIGDRFTMGPREAAYAIRLLGVAHVIPMHYGTFPALTGTPEALRDLTQDIKPLHIYALQPGEAIAGTPLKGGKMPASSEKVAQNDRAQ